MSDNQRKKSGRRGRHVVDDRDSQVRKRYVILGVMVAAFAAIVWVVDALVGSLLFYEKSFVELLLLGAPLAAFYTRLGLIAVGAAAIFFFLRSRITREKEEEFAGPPDWLGETLEAARIGMVATDKAGRIIEMNRVAEKMTGIEAMQAQNKKFADLLMLSMDEDAKSGGTPPLDTVLQTAEDVSLSSCVLVRLSDHKIMPVTGQMSAMLTKDGDMAGCVVTLSDLSERQTSELEQQRLITVVEQTPDSILITDPSGIIRYVNPAFEELTQIQSADIIERSARDLQIVVGEQPFVAEMIASLSAREPWRGQITFNPTTETTLTVESVITPILNRNGGIIGYAAVSRNITNEQRMQRELTQAQKMETVARMSGAICHEFNNILTGIYNFSELIMDNLAQDQKAFTYASEIRQAAMKGGSLTQQLLNFSRTDAVATDIISVNHVIDDLHDALMKLISEDIRLEVQLQPMLGLIRAGVHQVHQVIMNLCTNAREAMPYGGTLRIETRDDVFKSETGEETSCVVLTISDTGNGMTEEVLARAFEPFFSTKAQGVGSGLGLTVVYSFVQQYGLDIQIESNIGEGTTITIYLPTVDASAEFFDASHSMELPSVAGNETILFLDDDDLVRTSFGELLRGRGYNVVEAVNEHQALRAVDNHQFDIVVADVVLPETSSTEIMPKLRTRQPDLKVIYISGYAGSEAVAEARADEQARFLEKPFAPMKLLRAIRKMMDGIVEEKGQSGSLRAMPLKKKAPTILKKRE